VQRWSYRGSASCLSVRRESPARLPTCPGALVTVAGRLRAWRYREEVSRRQNIYGGEVTRERSQALQLDKLNIEWRRLLAISPYVARLRRELGLPDTFESLEQFVALVPSTNRATVQANLPEMRCQGRTPDFFRITGGSTAQPLQLPAWDSEIDATRPDVWVGREWYGITPASRLFLLWGHSHLLGSGLTGWGRGRLRALSDRLLGYQRVSAYDVRPESLRHAADVLERNPPEYIIGYSVALDLFAQVNADRADRLRSLGVKVVIGTAESFPSDQSAARIQSLFGCPVAMEYGAVETGLLAHTHPAGGFRVFWKTYMVDAAPSDQGYKLFVTSLYPRCFPLIRYEIGDNTFLAEDRTGPEVGIRRLAAVIGRCNDYVSLPTGAIVHSEFFTHALRMCSEIHAYQVVQANSGVFVRFVSPEPLKEATLAGIRERLARVHPSLDSIRLERVDQLRQTIAGKTRMVVSE